MFSDCVCCWISIILHHCIRDICTTWYTCVPMHSHCVSHSYPSHWRRLLQEGSPLAALLFGILWACVCGNSDKELCTALLVMTAINNVFLRLIRSFATRVTQLKKCIIFQEELGKIKFPRNYWRNRNIFDHIHFQTVHGELPISLYLHSNFWAFGWCR